MDPRRFEWGPLATWGSYSVPGVSAEQMELDCELDNVPAGGVAVDVGAGAGLSLAASIHVLRPDIQIVSVDPGFDLAATDLELFDACLEGTIAHFDDERHQEHLRGSRAWRETLLPGLAEDLPIEDGSADLVVSYAAVPFYAPEKQPVLDETLRVLRLGGLALHGPMTADDFEEWDAAIQRAKEAGQVSDYSSRTMTVQTTYGRDETVFFTRFVRQDQLLA